MDREQRARYIDWLRKGILAECAVVTLLAIVLAGRSREAAKEKFSNHTLFIGENYIKWVELWREYQEKTVSFPRVAV